MCSATRMDVGYALLDVWEGALVFACNEYRATVQPAKPGADKPIETLAVINVRSAAEFAQNARELTFWRPSIVLQFLNYFKIN